jgi:hypothetical protein
MPHPRDATVRHTASGAHRSPDSSIPTGTQPAMSRLFPVPRWLLPTPAQVRADSLPNERSRDCAFPDSIDAVVKNRALPFRASGVTSPRRTRHRSIEVRPGNGSTPSRSNQVRIVRGPQPGCSRRIATPASQRSGPSDEDTTTAATTDRPGPPTHDPRTSPASHAPSGAQRHNGGPRR